MMLLRQIAILVVVTFALVWPESAWLAEPNSGVHVEEVWSWATPPSAKVGAVYLTLRNDGPAADRLLSATAPIAESVEIHQMSTKDGVSRMKQLRALDLPAGAEVVLSPGGKHLMLFDLVRPLKVGENFLVTLQLEVAGTIEVEAVVRAMSLKRKPAGHLDHDSNERDHGTHGMTQ